LVLALRKAAAAEDFVLPDADAFYVKILRAGGMTVAGAIKVLENYYGHQKDCPKYFESATTGRCIQYTYNCEPNPDVLPRCVY
jgi:hypothetical protein